jgi:hypothetical protein
LETFAGVGGGAFAVFVSLAASFGLGSACAVLRDETAVLAGLRAVVAVLRAAVLLVVFVAIEKI